MSLAPQFIPPVQPPVLLEAPCPITRERLHPDLVNEMPARRYDATPPDDLGSVRPRSNDRSVSSRRPQQCIGFAMNGDQRRDGRPGPFAHHRPFPKAASAPKIRGGGCYPLTARLSLYLDYLVGRRT